MQEADTFGHFLADVIAPINPADSDERC